MADDPLRALVDALSEASASARRVAGVRPAGVRAVEPANGQRWYVCAFDGPRFLCLDFQHNVERDRRRVHDAAACALLVEHAEGLLELGEMDLLAASAAALSGFVEAIDLRDALGAMERAARALATWCAAPERAIASLPALEECIRMHDVARRQYERFVEGTEPLVAIQNELADELVGALREVEEAAGRAGILRPLAGAIAQAMDALDAGAGEITASHITPLEGP